ncbi:MAG: Hsp70 family protein, partial [Candidatus Diapherotrites archaeon]|nr:Hsp70 family protein [Candidatus Diapherotrites archaeon]
AKDLGTGKEQSIKIVASQKLTEEEIEKMKKDAEAHAEDDKKRKEEIDIVNQANALTFSTEKMLEDMKGKVDETKLDSIKKKNDELKELLGKEPKDITTIKTKTDEMSKEMQEIGTEIYQKAQQEQQAKQGAQGTGSGQQAGAEEKKGNDKVVDADYEVKDDKKEEDKKEGK